jgi:hypothetical protein
MFARSVYGPASPVGGGAVAVGEAWKFGGPGVDLGWRRAVRWDTSGAAPIELGNLGVRSDGVALSSALAVNAAGTAVGNAWRFDSGVDRGQRAVRWDPSGAVTELGHLGADSSDQTTTSAVAINAAGTAVGWTDKWAGFAYKGEHALRWDASGTAATELGNLGTDSSGNPASEAVAINTAGTAVGNSGKFDASGDGLGGRAVRWNASGTTATELGNLGTEISGITTSSAVAINDSGTAVGFADKWNLNTDFGPRAVRWDASGTAATELGNLGTDSGGATNSSAIAINAVGTAVGYAEKYVSGSDIGLRAVRWDASGTAATELGNLGTDGSGFTTSNAYAVNTAGITVGYADLLGVVGNSHAVAWGPDGVAIDLNTLLPADSGWQLFEADGITDTNWVSGRGWFDPDGPGGQDGYGRQFLLNISSVVPEPSGLVLLSLAGALSLRRQRGTPASF